MAEESVASERELKKIARDERNQEVKNQEKRLKAEYHKIAKSEAFEDLVAKIKSLSELHIRVAKDRSGMQSQLQADGTMSQVFIRLTVEDAAVELQRSAGIDEIGDYIARKLEL
jgi:glutamate-1-semialdehyde aminotransferase